MGHGVAQELLGQPTLHSTAAPLCVGSAKSHHPVYSSAMVGYHLAASGNGCKSVQATASSAFELQTILLDFLSWFTRQHHRMSRGFHLMSMLQPCPAGAQPGRGVMFHPAASSHEQRVPPDEHVATMPCRSTAWQRCHVSPGSIIA